MVWIDSMMYLMLNPRKKSKDAGGSMDESRVCNGTLNSQPIPAWQLKLTESKQLNALWRQKT